MPAPALGELTGVMFDLVAARRGPHWQLQPEEKTRAGESIANVLRHVNLPERELGIAADVAALGFVFYAIVQSRVELERRAIAAATNGRVVAFPTPAPAPTGPTVAETQPTIINDLDRQMRDAFPDGFNMNDPAHVERLNRIAANVDTTAGIEVGGDAVDPNRDVVRDAGEWRNPN